MSNTERDIWVTDLRNHPVIAQLVGNYFAQFVMLELILWKLSGHVLGTDEVGAMALLGDVQSISLRVDAIDRFADHAPLSVEEKDAVHTFLNRARQCIAFRNKLAHGAFDLDVETGELMASMTT